MYYKPHLVDKVTTASGEVLYDHAAAQGEQRIDPKVARNVTEAMRDVPEYDGAGLEGGRVAAAKTGTVQSHVEEQNNDAWMVGYTPLASTSIWVGTDDNTPIRAKDGRPIYGHGLPSEIWKSFMDEALEGTPKQTFGSFVPVAGSDPGETARGEGQQEGASTSGPSTTSSAPRSTPSGPPSASTSATTPATPVPTTAPAQPEAPAERAPAEQAAPAAEGEPAE
jgi:membrane peptidoglycan carboxypeptidase